MSGLISKNWVARVKIFLKNLWTDTKAAVLDKVELVDLPRKHRPKYSIVVLAVILSVLGFVMVFSAAPGLIDNIYTTAGQSCSVFGIFYSDNMIDCKLTEFLIIQAVYLVVGVMALLIAAKLPINFWRRIIKVVLGLAFLSSIVLFVAHLLGLSSIAPEIGGAVRWLNLGFVSFQPAELMKLAIVLFSASFLATAHQKGQLDSITKTVLPLMAVVLAGLLMVVVLQSDLSSGIVILAIVLAQMIVSGMRFRNIFGILASFLGVGVVAIILFPYRLARVMDFLNLQCLPDQNLEQICSALMSLGAGGFVGRGLGQSLSVFYVPQVMDDAVFSLVGETFGYIGAVAVMIVFFALLYRILSMTNYLRNQYLRLILAGVFGWIATQTAINIGAFTNSIPLTGITLPFISSGGSSLVCVMAAVGVCFNISRYTSYNKIGKEDQTDEDSVRRRRIGRTRYTGRSDNF
jgi:cell division protein FtsW